MKTGVEPTPEMLCISSVCWTVAVVQQFWYNGPITFTKKRNANINTVSNA